MDLLNVILHFAAFFVGLFVVIVTVLSAIRTFVLPRSAQDVVSRTVFRKMRGLFRLFLDGSYEQRDRIMAISASISLLILQLVWLSMLVVGYMGMYLAVGNQTPETAFKVSGSSLFTLGFAVVDDLPSQILSFSEAALGLIMVAL